MGDSEQATRNYELAKSYNGALTDKGPFYHGTKADLKVGDFLIAGGNSNYKPGLKMNHIYFTANVNGAGLAAALAKGKGRERKTEKRSRSELDSTQDRFVDERNLFRRRYEVTFSSLLINIHNS
mgnify:FL=1